MAIAVVPVGTLVEGAKVRAHKFSGTPSTSMKARSVTRSWNTRSYSMVTDSPMTQKQVTK